MIVKPGKFIPGKWYQAVNENDVGEPEPTDTQDRKIMVLFAQIQRLYELQKSARSLLHYKPEVSLLLNALIATIDDSQIGAAVQWIRANKTNKQSDSKTNSESIALESSD